MTTTDTLTESDRALVGDLETCAIEAGAFGHSDHVRAAWAMLQEEPLERVIPRFEKALRRFAAHHDAPGLYHETITRAFLIAIDQRIRHSAERLDWRRFRDRHPELFENFRVFLGRHYSPEILDSELAKRSFVPPDRSPLAPLATMPVGPGSQGSDQLSTV